MTWTRAAVAIAAIGLLAAGLLRHAAGGDGAGAPRPDGTAAARVVRVVDGDTIVARLAGGKVERVRYIGMDTPETKKPDTPVQCYGPAASARNERLVAGRRVELRFGAELRDRYGRLLAFVSRTSDGLDVGAALLRGGYARTLEIPPNTERAAHYARIAAAARTRRRGLWGSCARG